MDRQQIQLLLPADELCFEIVRLLFDEDTICESTEAQWKLVIDLPTGFALNSLSGTDNRAIIIATTNPCPEYRLDLLGFNPAAVLPLAPLNSLTKLVEAVQTYTYIAEEPITPLTPSERMTLMLIAYEHSYSEIARIRSITPGTVKNTLGKIYLKLNLRSGSQAAHYYYGRWNHLLNEQWSPPSHVEVKPSLPVLEVGGLLKQMSV